MPSSVCGVVEWPDELSVPEVTLLLEMRRIMDWKRKGTDWEKRPFM